MPTEPGTNGPNVVVFTVDQLGARWLEPPCADAVPTPNIDRLRSRGVTFENAFASNPLCAPSRATMATGLSARGHGVLTNGYELDPEIPTFVRLLGEAGWRTGGFGKFHFVPQFSETHPEYGPYGFDETAVTEDQRTGEWLDWVRAEHPAQFEAALATVPRPDNPALASYGPDGEDLSDRVAAAREAIEWGTDEHPENTERAYTLPFPEEVSQTNWITRNALSFCDDADRPFLAWVSYVQPHYPSCPPARCLERVDADAIPEPIPPEWPDDPHAPACFSEGDPARHAHPEIPDDWRRRRQYYLGDVVHLDEQLGRLLDALEAAGELEETVVVLLADHGEHLYDHGFTGKAQKHYDGGIRVPLTVAGPGLDEGVTRGEFVELEDLFPTILELAGVGAPTVDTWAPSVGDGADVPAHAGSSLVPLCRGEHIDGWREAAYVESYNNIYSTSPTHWARTIRTGEYRYTLYPAGGGEQLFEIDDRPTEPENLAGDPAYGHVKRELKDRLLERVVLGDHPYPPRDLVSIGMP
ncbi:MAG: sulfatase [Haloarculaceae archaeon]